MIQSPSGRRSFRRCASCARAGPLDQTDPAERLITFEYLLTHRSGLTYGDLWPGPLAAAYEEALGGAIDSEVAPDEWIARLAALPLIDQPGVTLHYGHSTDLLGLLIARIEDAPLGDVLQRRIFSPLGMKDTGYGHVVGTSIATTGNRAFLWKGQERTFTGPGGSAGAFVTFLCPRKGHL